VAGFAIASRGKYLHIGMREHEVKIKGKRRIKWVESQSEFLDTTDYYYRIYLYCFVAARIIDYLLFVDGATDGTASEHHYSRCDNNSDHSSSINNNAKHIDIRSRITVTNVFLYLDWMNVCCVSNKPFRISHVKSR